jgi:hypothetical protein
LGLLDDGGGSGREGYWILAGGVGKLWGLNAWNGRGEYIRGGFPGWW